MRTTRSLYKSVDAAEERCENLEQQLNIDRWTEEDPDYQAALKYQRERQYRLALDKVERLVVQRLFELQKCHIRGTSKFLSYFRFVRYRLRIFLPDVKLRKHITTHLNSRSAALRTALKQYNLHASKLRRQKFTFEQVIEQDFLSKSDLLRDARDDIRVKPWANTNNRLLRDTYYKTERAKEEIERLNVEIRRIWVYMKTEEEFYSEHIAALNNTQPYLASGLQRQLEEKKRAHESIRKRLTQCERLRRYTGPTLNNERGDSEEDEWESEDEHNHLDDLDLVLSNMEKLG